MEHGGSYVGQSSKQVTMEGCPESHSASILFHIHQSLFFYIEKWETFKKEKMFLFSLFLTSS